MGRWLDRVKQTTPSNDRAGSGTTQAEGMAEPTEPTKAPSVGFVGSVSGGTPKTISVHREIIRACNLAGLSLQDIEPGLSDDDLADISQGLMSAEMLAAYATLFRHSGYFWIRDSRISKSRDEGLPQQPKSPTEIDKPSAFNTWPNQKRQVRDQFINHLMACSYCFAPRDRYCEGGRKWRELLYSM